MALIRLLRGEPPLWAKQEKDLPRNRQVPQKQPVMSDKLLSLLKLAIGLAMLAGIAVLSLWRILD